MAVVNGTAGSDLIHVTGDGVLTPPGFINLPQATALGDTLSGLGGADIIYGRDGDDLIDGGDDNDILIGGAGEDTLLGGDGIDSISYAESALGVGIDLTTGSGSSGDAEGDVINGVENVEGTGFADGITGSAVDNSLWGLGGADTLRGEDGNDTLAGDAGNDALYGGNGNDTINGGADDDFIRGGDGADHLDGGAGIDTVDYIGPAGVTVDLSTGLASGGEAQGDVLTGFENIGGTAGFGDVLTGSAVANRLNGFGGNDVLNGLAGDDQLIGNSGDDILRGGAGADAINGADGIDLVSFYGATVGVSVFLNTGTGIGGDAQGDTYFGVENVNGGKTGDLIIGDTAANVLTGYEGDDQLAGGEGTDSLLGGDGGDLLRGDAGADHLEGGAGIDTIDYEGPVGVTIDLGTGLGSGGDAQGDTFAGIESVRGTSSHGDDITGSAAANRLDGFGGNDDLNGLGGADSLIGGSGDDTALGGDGDDLLYVAAGADVLDGGAGIDTIVFVSPTTADWQSGMLDANIGTDTLSNWEVMQGSTGDDRIRTLSQGFAVELRGGTGNDVLAAGVDGVIGDTLSGDAGDDQLDGGAGNDVLRGGAGADVLAGGAGTDTASYYTGTVGILVSLATGLGSGGEAQGDTLTGIENLNGGQGGDSLYGNADANALQGWNGNDVLVGRAGKDMLTGGVGGDRFTFAAIGESVVGANADRITDFSQAQGDKVDLAGIDANGAMAGDQAFSFIGSGLFTGDSGQLRFAVTAPGVTTIAGDINGDKVSDFHITLTGTVALVAGDFVL